MNRSKTQAPTVTVKHNRVKTHNKRMAAIKYNLEEARNKTLKRLKKSLRLDHVIARQKHLISKEIIENKLRKEKA